MKEDEKQETRAALAFGLAGLGAATLSARLVLTRTVVGENRAPHLVIFAYMLYGACAGVWLARDRIVTNAGEEFRSRV